MPVQLELPPQGVLKPNDADDPLPYYYHPLVGWLYRHRLQMGLDFLPDEPREPSEGSHTLPRRTPLGGAELRPRAGQRVLEVGVGSGVLVPTLTKRYAEYTGTDLTLAPGLDALVTPGCHAEFRTADLLRDGDLPAAHYDAIVCFSVLEHIRDADGAARSLARALAPGGTLITGYPMVSRLMTRAFALIGYDRIDDHHVCPPAKIAAALGTVLTPTRRAAFPPHAPVGVALYQCTAWTTRTPV
ncbi:MAG TPA: methyltransferase domain-containing protein [Polyangia bacterium]|nr:methyltransferase domain-containing protein [Polyangia bacterium]